LIAGIKDLREQMVGQLGEEELAGLREAMAQAMQEFYQFMKEKGFELPTRSLR
jgi:hypothetical protein